MRGPPALGLHEQLGLRRDPFHFGSDLAVVRPDDYGAAPAIDGRRRQDVGDERPPGDGMQHLRLQRPHAGPLAGCEHHGHARVCFHWPIRLCCRGLTAPPGSAQSGAKTRASAPACSLGCSLRLVLCRMIRGGRETGMVRSKARALELDDDGGDHPMLGRFLLWAGLAAVAMGFDALAAQTRTGSQRIAALLDNDGSSTTVAIRSEALAGSTRPTEADLETRRVAEQVRALTADRDRLLARLDALERNIEVTGAISREAP